MLDCGLDLLPVLQFMPIPLVHSPRLATLPKYSSKEKPELEGEIRESTLQGRFFIDCEPEFRGKLETKLKLKKWCHWLMNFDFSAWSWSCRLWKHWRHFDLKLHNHVGIAIHHGRNSIQWKHLHYRAYSAFWSIIHGRNYWVFRTVFTKIISQVLVQYAYLENLFTAFTRQSTEHR